MIVMAAEDRELLEYARSKGARGINVAGLCCDGERSGHAPRRPHGGQLPAAGKRPAYRNCRDDRGGCAVHLPRNRPFKQMLPYKVYHDLPHRAHPRLALCAVSAAYGPPAGPRPRAHGHRQLRKPRSGQDLCAEEQTKGQSRLFLRSNHQGIKRRHQQPCGRTRYV